VRLWVRRKTLGGLQTDLSARVLGPTDSRWATSTRRVRLQASAAAACTATGRWKAFLSGYLMLGALRDAAAAALR
jgi:predicted oxidoreductase